LPGISIVLGCNTLSTDRVAGSLQEMQHRDKYKVVQYFQNDKTVIAFSGYEGYPLQYYEDENVLFFLEGLLYDKTDQEIDGFLRRIVDEYFEKKPYKRRIAELIEDSDGDFIGLIYFKNEETMIIFNDRWGRLPAFFLAEDRIFAFSRERKFLLNWISSITFDKIAMTEFLIYHYNLGQKTLVKGIIRLDPAAILEVKSSDGKIRVKKDVLLPVNFETKDLKLNRGEVIDRCVKLYRESLSARVGKIQETELPIVADLSGGYDSRAIFGGLCQMGVDFTPCTDNLITGDESHIAKQLTDFYNKKLCQFSPSHPVDDFSILRKITYLTDCTATGWHAVSNYYVSLEREKLFTEPSVRFMGFGGEFIRHPYRLNKHYPTFAAMLEDAAYTDYLSPSWALAITKLNPQEFGKSLEREVARFPEQEIADKVKHLYFEYYNKTVNGGEDRARIFSWTVQPLWGKNLLTFEMKNIPPKMISFKFFIDFLEKLDHNLLKIPIYGSNLRLDSRIESTFYRIKKYLKTRARANRYIFKLYKWIDRKFHKNPEEFSGAVNEIRKLSENNFVSKQFDIAAVEEYLLQSPRILEVYQLLTLMIYVDEVDRRFGQKVKY